MALLKKALDFRIDRGESQLFGRICRRIYPLDHQATTTTATNGRRREALPTFRLRCLCCCPCPTWLQQAYQLAVGQLLPKNSLETASIEAALRRNPYYCLLTPAVSPLAGPDHTMLLLSAEATTVTGGVVLPPPAVR